MSTDCFSTTVESSIPIEIVPTNEYSVWVESQPTRVRNWLQANHFKAEHDNHCLIPNDSGALDKVILLRNEKDILWCAANLPLTLPENAYHFEGAVSEAHITQLSIGWGLGAYQFTRYKAGRRDPARLQIADYPNHIFIQDCVSAIDFVRNLINTPTEDMHPETLALECQELALAYSASYQEVKGEALIEQGFHAIHAVGRAGGHAPRLIDFSWGDVSAPKITLVGKGVCFDSGGLNIKSSHGMRLMKKDMGGAANVLGLAQLIMATELPIRLRVLIPAVENAISSIAYRPGDVIASHSGKTIEIGNTDAEGRVILADALSLACLDTPDIIICLATLTGAARVAMGPEVPALFCDDDEIADCITQAGVMIQDPLWRMPLYQPYAEMNKSKIADITNNPSSGFGGAITAALFLQSFVNAIPWVHMDMMAWNPSSKPGRCEGGEAMGIRALYQFLCERYMNGQ